MNSETRTREGAVHCKDTIERRSFPPDYSHSWKPFVFYLQTIIISSLAAFDPLIPLYLVIPLLYLQLEVLFSLQTVAC